MADDDQIQISDERGITVVRLGADFASIYESDLLRLSQLRDLASSVTPAQIVIDLANTRYFGSAFIGFLISIASRLNERNSGRLCLTSLAPFATMALEATKADSIMSIYGSIDDAVTALRPSDN
jgi:anti-anti-sigma factor